MRIGFDLDGCLCDLDVNGLDRIHATPITERKPLELAYYSSRRPLLEARMFLHTLDTPFVVTARGRYLKDVTELWLRRHFDGWPVYFTEDYSGIPEAEMWGQGMDSESIAAQIAEAKASALKELGASIYLEDHPLVVAELRRLLPQVAILQFGGRV